MWSFLNFILITIALLVLSFANVQVAIGQTATTNNAITNGDSEILNAQQLHAIKMEVTGVATVKKLLPEDDQGLRHQKFLLVLSNGTTVLVAHNIDIGQKLPIQPGDRIRIHGEYIWNPKGGLIHWTHRSDTPYHQSGWIELNGQHYD